MNYQPDCKSSMRSHSFLLVPSWHMLARLVVLKARHRGLQMDQHMLKL